MPRRTLDPDYRTLWTSLLSYVATQRRMAPERVVASSATVEDVYVARGACRAYDDILNQAKALETEEGVDPREDGNETEEEDTHLAN